VSTASQKIDLDRVRIASPCHVGWANMKGDDKVRFCERCRMHVYNLSGMTRAEAETLIRNREGQMCVSIFRRLDGTVLTTDCPVGLNLARRAAVKALGTVAVCASLMLSLAVRLGVSGETIARLRDLEPFKRISTWLTPPPPPVARPPALFGSRSDGGIIP